VANNLEVEVKLPLPASVANIRRKLRSLGYRVIRTRSLEQNTVFDAEGLTLRAKNQLLRLRRYGSHRVLTYKGPPTPGKHKSREELEISVADPGKLSLILMRLGYRPVFLYEKYRTEFAPPKGRGMVTLDETPVGNFLEIEGRAGFIDRAAKALGFSEADYNTKSYGALYLEFCKRRGIEPGDMVFRRKTKA
jgi:adenylate cyclase class 2